MPPASQEQTERRETGKGKGKLRRANEEQFDVRRFIDEQIELYGVRLDGPLVSNVQVPTELEQKFVDKIARLLSRELAARRQLKFHEGAVEAIVEQIEYLRMSRARPPKEVTIQSDGCIRVDIDYWLEDLPNRWPDTVQDEGDSVKAPSQESLKRYRSLLRTVRTLDEKQRMLEEKERHYAFLVETAREARDAATLHAALPDSSARTVKSKSGESR